MMVFINTTLCPYNLFICRFHRNPNSHQLMQHLLIINSIIQKHAMYVENGPLIAYRWFMMIYLYLPTIADLHIFMMIYLLKMVISCWFTSTKWWWSDIFLLKFGFSIAKQCLFPQVLDITWARDEKVSFSRQPLTGQRGFSSGVQWTALHNYIQ